MDSLFGEGTSLPVRFFIAFVVVFALIGATAWLIRRFGTGALGGVSARGRAPRLAVIEAGAVDGRRKLVLIRRDNIEHLIMIGGPTDIVVEANIVRGQNTREAATPRTSSAADSLPRALPVGDDNGWPLQPEPAPRATRPARPASLDDAAHWALPPEPAAPATPAPPSKRSRSAETLAGLAAELSVRPSEPAAPAPKSAPAPAPAPEPVRAAAKPAPAPAPAATSASADQNLADMASRLEAALRRPAPAPTPPARPVTPPPAPKPAAPAAEAPRVAPIVAPPVAPPAPPPAVHAPEPVVAAAAPAPAPAAEKPAEAARPAPAKTDDVFGSIEEEMANLLGRPAGKPS